MLNWMAVLVCDFSRPARDWGHWHSRRATAAWVGQARRRGARRERGLRLWAVRARCRGPGLPGAVRVVPVASAGAAQIPCEHPYGIHDPAAVLRLPASW